MIKELGASPGAPVAAAVAAAPVVASAAAPVVASSGGVSAEEATRVVLSVLAA